MPWPFRTWRYDNSRLRLRGPEEEVERFYQMLKKLQDGMDDLQAERANRIRIQEHLAHVIKERDELRAKVRRFEFRHGNPEIPW